MWAVDELPPQNCASPHPMPRCAVRACVAHAARACAVHAHAVCAQRDWRCHALAAELPWHRRGGASCNTHMGGRTSQSQLAMARCAGTTHCQPRHTTVAVQHPRRMHGALHTNVCAARALSAGLRRPCLRRMCRRGRHMQALTAPHALVPRRPVLAAPHVSGLHACRRTPCWWPYESCVPRTTRGCAGALECDR